jgi:hypothetical protein
MLDHNVPLKPCPFCGASAELTGDAVTFFNAGCSACSAETRGNSMTAGEAIALWNARPSAPGAYAELVGRLTNLHGIGEALRAGGGDHDGGLTSLCHEAAAAITALVAEQDRLREALEGFLAFSSEDYDRKSDRAAAIVALKKKARAALATEKERG